MKTDKTIGDSHPNLSQPRPDRILGGLDYLQQCLREARPFAVVSGPPGSGKAALLEQFRREPGTSNLVYLSDGLQDPHELLESALIQLGFEPFESSASELQSLLSVFLRHEQANGRHTVIILPEAQHCGPRVLELIQTLATQHGDGQASAVTFLLTGPEDLHRILDSAGMLAVSAMTSRRFNMDAGTQAANESGQAPQIPAQRAALLVSRNGELLARHDLRRPQLLIGRSEENDIAISSRFVSRHHALLISRPDGAYIVDMKSTNGTFVNAVAVSQQALRDGDVITIGEFRLKYVNPALPRAARLGDIAPGSVVDTMVMPASNKATQGPQSVPAAQGRQAS